MKKVYDALEALKVSAEGRNNPQTVAVLEAMAAELAKPLAVTAKKKPSK